MCTEYKNVRLYPEDNDLDDTGKLYIETEPIS